MQNGQVKFLPPLISVDQINGRSEKMFWIFQLVKKYEFLWASVTIKNTDFEKSGLIALIVAAKLSQLVQKLVQKVITFSYRHLWLYQFTVSGKKIYQLLASLFCQSFWSHLGKLLSNIALPGSKFDGKFIRKCLTVRRLFSPRWVFIDVRRYLL